MALLSDRRDIFGSEGPDIIELTFIELRRRLDSSRGREPANSALGSEWRVWIQTLPVSRPNIVPRRLREKRKECSAPSVPGWAGVVWPGAAGVAVAWAPGCNS